MISSRSIVPSSACVIREKIEVRALQPQFLQRALDDRVGHVLIGNAPGKPAEHMCIGAKIAERSASAPALRVHLRLRVGNEKNLVAFEEKIGVEVEPLLSGRGIG